MDSGHQSVLRHCYCNATDVEMYMLHCKTCSRSFHSTCLKTGPPSPLAGDVYFRFICEGCSPEGKEIVERMKLQWTLVVILALYNLQIRDGGKCGYFRWREDICKFIDHNWTVFFGADRKKAATWHHTVAGILSNYCNKYFMSGSEQLHEKGWWTLKEKKLPTLVELETIAGQKSISRRTKQSLGSFPVVDGPRQRQQNVVEAALALKAKRTAAVVGCETPKSKRNRADKLQLKIRLTQRNDYPSIKRLLDGSSSSSIDSPLLNVKSEHGCEFGNIDKYSSGESSLSNSRSGQETVSELSGSAGSDNALEWIKDEPVDDINMDVNYGYVSQDLDFSLVDALNETLNETVIKEEDVASVSGVSSSHSKGPKYNKEMDKFNRLPQNLEGENLGRKRKVITKEEVQTTTELVEPNFMPLNAYEEHQVLNKLKEMYPYNEDNTEFRRFYRKLSVRQLQRANNIQVFDIDRFIHAAKGRPYVMDSESKENRTLPKQQEILDRYHIPDCFINDSLPCRASFFSRLMGLDDDQYNSIISPYTSRLLKPFIFRDYKTVPLKLKLLREIVAHHHREDPIWKAPPHHPIDFCYVRPQHIPAVNALCQEFFWPSIDMSECLQYPDFSCVALYRKVVIGFAFMVPDVKFDEAYISFILTHPDWRRAGIAKFMLYHLIQTCMGKDITLHVSATSPAVFLYQKFGFKVEEYILDFYDKYLPAESRDCRHALFLRLSR